MKIELATDFTDIDFPQDSLSPMTKETTEGGMKLTWRASDLITSQDIGVCLPEKLNPGPLARAFHNRYPWRIASLGQLFYLVLFSYSFFLKGMTGLTVTIASVMTLAVLMKVTARVDWTEVFQRQA